VVGWLTGRSPEADAPLAVAFGKGLAETGYVAGRNVAIESHWAYGQIPHWRPICCSASPP